ncbi:EAL domain-containing protein [Arthrobacter sp. NQ7]|uniref:EAL domain-containing protein n=1 Tax=Arthrobacter sp. NQ7 TaxID=3032303 RepID=UPI00240FC8CD|nr:EAL domain-containing protein [Arthrobacter sp. NQ7]MDJ0459330.1 EAL domain-containing protein [Arthrobacter sp. NQ7]
MSEATAREVMARVSALSSRRKRPLLVGASWMEALGHRARNVFAATWPLTRVAVIGTSAVDEVVYVFYVARHQPACPALNLAPETCLDPRLPRLVNEAPINLDRIVLELTERQSVEDYDSLLTALAPLRKRGLRIAVDDAGSGFSSMRHILHLQPDIIKLDRSLITGIHANPRQRALGAAMVQFAQETGATIVAEGLETEDDLATTRNLGIHAGQGYLLGHPTTRPADWATWHTTSARASSTANEHAA